MRIVVDLVLNDQTDACCWEVRAVVGLEMKVVGLKYGPGRASRTWNIAGHREG